LLSNPVLTYKGKSRFDFVSALKSVILQHSAVDEPVFLEFKDGVAGFANKLEKIILSKPELPLTIGIAGESGGGKTAFVEAIARSEITILNGDNFYKDWSGGLNDPDRSNYLITHVEGFSFDDPVQIDFEVMQKCFNSLACGNAVRIPEYNFCTCASMPEKIYQSPPELALILESIFALNSCMENEYDITMYVDTPHDVIKERWYERAASRGITGETADIRFNDVQEKADIHIRSAKSKADILINGQAPLENTIKCFNTIFNNIYSLKNTDKKQISKTACLEAV